MRFVSGLEEHSGLPWTHRTRRLAMPRMKRIISTSARRLSERNSLTFSTVRHARSELSNTRVCPACRKLCLRCESEARALIGLLLHSRIRLKPGCYALHPYRCPINYGWHIGRDPRVLNLNFSAGTAKSFRCSSRKILRPDIQSSSLQTVTSNRRTI